MKSICVDASFLIGLYDETDEHHTRAKTYFRDYFDSKPNRLLVPWPILYETVSTRMVRNRARLFALQSDWKRLDRKKQLELVSDAAFRKGVVEECFDELGSPLNRYRPLSAVDRILRRMLSDTNTRIHAFVTFNARDFRDVCDRFGREIHP